jgi:small subunit ribosomal protein S20
MPIIKSAKKRVRVTQKASVRNAKTKKGLRASLKAFHAALTGGKNASEAHSKTHSAIDKAVKKGVISRNKAARQKRRLNALAKASGNAKPTAKAKAPAKKAAAKKPAPAKKKPVAKKKPAAKKK